MEKIPESTNRPTEEQIRQKVSNMLKEKNKDFSFYNGAVNDLRNLAQGRDDQGIGEEFYPGWAKEDFSKLLKELGEDPGFGL